jgi:hypothetical protein
VHRALEGISAGWSRGAATLALALLLSAGTAAAAPAALNALETGLSLELHGEGELRWFGLRIYRARLWTEAGNYSPKRPFALELRYRRSFSAEQLAATSVSEMRRLGYHDAPLAEWERRMRELFPDVRPGDRLIGLSLPGEGAVFFSDTDELGRIDDPQFAEAFFGIWLDPRTRAGELRRTLLGEGG